MKHGYVEVGDLLPIIFLPSETMVVPSWLIGDAFAYGVIASTKIHVVIKIHSKVLVGMRKHIRKYYRAVFDIYIWFRRI